MHLATDENWTVCNSSELGSNCSHSTGKTPSYWALALLLIPTLTLSGNLLVIISVVTKRNLHSPINFFILGLAVADMCVAMAVMPFAVYVEFNEQWELGTVLCDLYCAADVTCSTASIFLLTVISFDRYVAATQPIRYANSAKGISRVAIINFAVWLVSMLIASPMVLGLNNVPDRDKSKCMFYNADFLIYSSTGSFCIPLVIIVYLYARIYCVIRQRGRFAKQRQGLISAATRPSIASNGMASTSKQQLFVPKAPLPSVIEYPLSPDEDDINSTTDNDQETTPNSRSRSATTDNANGAPKWRHYESRNGITDASPATQSQREARRSSSFHAAESILDPLDKSLLGDGRKVVSRSHSNFPATSTWNSKEATRPPAECENGIGPKSHSPSNYHRHFSLTRQPRHKRETRRWSMARSTNVVREAPLEFDPSTFAAFRNGGLNFGGKTVIDSQKGAARHENAKILRCTKISASSSSAKTARHSSIATESGSSVTIICPSDEANASAVDPASVPRQSPTTSLSAMFGGVRRLNDRKRMSEGCSPLLLHDNRTRLMATGKGSMDVAAEHGKARWLRRLSTRLILWRFQRNGRLSDPGTDTATSIVDRDGIKQPLLLRHEKRMKTQRKSASKSQRKEKKATKTLAIVLGIFLICWLPFFTLNLLNAVCIKLKKQSCQVGFLPFFLTTWLGYTNSLMNPIIYTIFNADFRRAFKEILCPHHGKRRSSRA